MQFIAAEQHKGKQATQLKFTLTWTGLQDQSCKTGLQSCVACCHNSQRAATALAACQRQQVQRREAAQALAVPCKARLLLHTPPQHFDYR